MIIDLPSTSTSAINKTLVDLRDSGGAVALGRVLTLCVVTDDAHAEDAISAANEASREHPCRVIVLARGNRRGTARLDAQIRVGGDAGASEVIVLRAYGPLVDAGETTVVSLLLPDAPIVAWWPGTAPEDLSTDPIGRIAQRRITDSAEAPNPARALEQRRATYRPGDTDLAWTRLTNWRALLSAALDQPPYEAVTGIAVAGAPDSPSTELLAAWLTTKLKAPVVRARTKKGTGVQSVRLDRKSGAVELIRPDQNVATLTQPGQPDRRIALARRPVKDCLTEELRRLDPDEVYGEILHEGLMHVSATMSVRDAQAQGRISAPAQTARSQAAAEQESARVSRAMKRATPGEPVSRRRSPAEAAAAESTAAARKADPAERPSPGKRAIPAKRAVPSTKGPATAGTAKKAAAATKSAPATKSASAKKTAASGTAATTTAPAAARKATTRTSAAGKKAAARKTATKGATA